MMSSGGLETGFASDVLLPLALAVIMFGMGLNLTPLDFRRVARMPKAVLVGLAAQLLALPALALLVALVFHHAFGLAPALAAGLLILACCPGGATSNLLTYLARADAALSVTLTSVTSLGAAVLTPATFVATTYILSGSARVVEVAFGDMMTLVLAMVAVPVVAGMLVRHRRPGFAARAERPFRVASVLFFALVVAGVIAQNRAEFWTLAARAVPAALTLNVLALGAGLALGRLAGLSTPASRALAIEVGFQNGTLGIALAITQLGSAEAAIVPGFYGLVMFVTGGALAWVWSRDVARKETDAHRVAIPSLEAPPMPRPDPAAELVRELTLLERR